MNVFILSIGFFNESTHTTTWQISRVFSSQESARNNAHAIKKELDHNEWILIEEYQVDGGFLGTDFRICGTKD